MSLIQKNKPYFALQTAFKINIFNKQPQEYCTLTWSDRRVHIHTDAQTNTGVCSTAADSDDRLLTELTITHTRN